MLPSPAAAGLFFVPVRRGATTLGAETGDELWLGSIVIEEQLARPPALADPKWSDVSYGSIADAAGHHRLHLLGATSGRSLCAQSHPSADVRFNRFERALFGVSVVFAFGQASRRVPSRPSLLPIAAREGAPSSQP